MSGITRSPALCTGVPGELCADKLNGAQGAYRQTGTVRPRQFQQIAGLPSARALAELAEGLAAIVEQCAALAY